MRSRSSSTSSSSSTSFEDPIQIFVKISGGKTLPILLPPSESVSNLVSQVSSHFHLPSESLRLLYSGRHLTAAEPSTPLKDFQIHQNSTLYILSPVRGGMAPPKKPRCSFKECKERAQPIVGNCGFCEGHFCGKHRMLESHACTGLEDCKKESHARNAEKLNAEKTIVVKGV